MAEIAYYLPDDDPTVPLVPKPRLQQYDNYQTYHVVCVDVAYQVNNINGEITGESDKNVDTLAIQAFSPHPITCNFVAIANAYP
jgi:hypothetical protein